MKLLITGSKGFVGKNLLYHLKEIANIQVLTYVRGDSNELLSKHLKQADAMIHLASEIRPKSTKSFENFDTGITRFISNNLQSLNKIVPIIYTSSNQVQLENPYGKSKLAAENILKELSLKKNIPIAIYRLPGIFGKWCKPNYNSVVATFCFNKINNLKININDPEKILKLCYIDDVIASFTKLLNHKWSGVIYPKINPIYEIKIRDLVSHIDDFNKSRSNLTTERVGTGIKRALFSTYLSYLPKTKFVYDIHNHSDKRGRFVEFLKTIDSGQFSYFTSYPGVTRGEHFHHTKSEKFLVLKGNARFGFRNIITNECHYVETKGDKPQIVETVPGWTHNITNIGKEEMVVMLWANEVFDKSNPDTIMSSVNNEEN
jgi:UDP-2-acetamido-2,6-beta-L-arabino-hexul-4-ose reductase